MSRPPRLNPSRTVDTSEDAAERALSGNASQPAPSNLQASAPSSTAQYARETITDHSRPNQFEPDQIQRNGNASLGSGSLSPSTSLISDPDDEENVLARIELGHVVSGARGRFLASLDRWPCVKTAAATAGLSVQAFYAYRERHPEFGEAWDRALASGVAELERLAMARAFKGIRRAQRYKGVIVGYELEYSDRLAERLLEAHAPEKYGRKLNVNQTGTVTHAHTYGITPELERLVHRIAGARGLDAPEPVTIDQEPATTGPADVLRRMLGNPEDGAEPLPVVQERVE